MTCLQKEKRTANCLSDFRHKITINKIDLRASSYKNNDASLRVIKAINVRAKIKQTVFSQEVGGYITNNVNKKFIIKYSTELLDMLNNTKQYNIDFMGDKYSINGVMLSHEIKREISITAIKISKND